MLRSQRRSIEPLTKEASLDLVRFTEQLFLKVDAEGYAKVVCSGRTIKSVTVTPNKGATP